MVTIVNIRNYFKKPSIADEKIDALRNKLHVKAFITEQKPVNKSLRKQYLRRKKTWGSSIISVSSQDFS